jgi:1,4-alpha-glucan branching enzyme
MEVFMKNQKFVNLSFQKPEAKSVFIVGSFNNWDQSKTPLKPDKSGKWTCKLKLTPGTYEYKFLVNGDSWETDPTNEVKLYNNFGTENSILDVK